MFGGVVCLIFGGRRGGSAVVVLVFLLFAGLFGVASRSMLGPRRLLQLIAVASFLFLRRAKSKCIKRVHAKVVSKKSFSCHPFEPCDTLLPGFPHLQLGFA